MGTKPKYMGFVSGSQSGMFETVDKARDWVDKQLDQKPTVNEGYVLETIERVYKTSPPIAREPISAQADLNDIVGKTHTGTIGAPVSDIPAPIVNGG